MRDTSRFRRLSKAFPIRNFPLYSKLAALLSSESSLWQQIWLSSIKARCQRLLYDHELSLLGTFTAFNDSIWPWYDGLEEHSWCCPCVTHFLHLGDYDC